MRAAGLTRRGLFKPQPQSIRGGTLGPIVAVTRRSPQGPQKQIGQFHWPALFVLERSMGPSPGKGR
jgi:hypothetical protein